MRRYVTSTFFFTCFFRASCIQTFVARRTNAFAFMFGLGLGLGLRFRLGLYRFTFALLRASIVSALFVLALAAFFTHAFTRMRS